MKLTPLDIHHKEFRYSLRGYNQEEVDAFLDEVADEFERLFKENIDLSEKLESANDKVRSYAEIEKTLHNTMLAAQTSAEEIKARAANEADTLLRDAEIKAKELIQAALAEKQKTQSELLRIKSAEDDFRLRFRQMLEDYMRAIHELGVEPQAAAIAGLASEAGAAGQSTVVDEPRFVEDDLRPPAFVLSEPEPSATLAGSKPIPPFKPDLDAAGVSASEVPPADGSTRPHARATRHLDGGTPSLELDDPPSTGFVQSLTLGEVAGPDLRSDTPTFEDPSEFGAGQRGLVGERDDDPDIEEID
jgi:cell division initiation protein